VSSARRSWAAALAVTALTVTALAAAALGSGCAGRGPRPAAPPPADPPSLVVELDAAQRRRIAQNSPIPPPPPDPTNRYADDPRAALLGQALFFERRLSERGDTSCATCHVPDTGFTDRSVHRVAPGEHLRKTPTLLHVGHQRWFGWDGRQDSLWAQALAPLEAAREHASSRLHVVRVIHRDPLLRGAFAAVFGEWPDLSALAAHPEHARPVRGSPDHPHQRAWEELGAPLQARIDALFAQVGKALAAYERQLVGGPAPFDRFAAGLARGDGELVAALGPAEQRGASLFFGRANCHLCHNGPLFSDLEFHDTLLPFADDDHPDRGRHLGIDLLREDPFNGRGAHSDAPESLEGRKLTFLPRKPHQYAEFKTATLRALGPGPFMHRGDFASLAAVLRHYATLESARQNAHGGERILVPLDLGPQDLTDLEAFLRSVESTPPPAELLAPPAAERLAALAAEGIAALAAEGTMPPSQN
jgi:cytochrome c peroxidase